MRLKETIEVGSTVIITVIAVLMAGVYFRDRQRGPEIPTYETARIVEDWESENALGIRRGATDARVVITEFIDFQCPFCAALAPTIDSLVTMFRNDVAVVFHHFPLPGHENAVPAAIAAECAAEQDRFWPMYEALFQRQSALGSTEWESFAEDARVPDVGVFSDCINRPADSFTRITLGRALGTRTGVTATPTTWVNGRVFRPTVEHIRELLEEMDK